MMEQCRAFTVKGIKKKWIDMKANAFKFGVARKKPKRRGGPQPE